MANGTVPVRTAAPLSSPEEEGGSDRGGRDERGGVGAEAGGGGEGGRRTPDRIGREEHRREVVNKTH